MNSQDASTQVSPKRDSKNLYRCSENLEGRDGELLKGGSSSTWTPGSRAKPPTQHPCTEHTWLDDGWRQDRGPSCKLGSASMDPR